LGGHDGIDAFRIANIGRAAVFLSGRRGDGRTLSGARATRRVSGRRARRAAARQPAGDPLYLDCV